MSSKYIWQEVTPDDLQLPLKQADTAKELAEMCGTSVGYVTSSWSHYKHGYRKTTRYIRIKLDDEEGVNDVEVYD